MDKILFALLLVASFLLSPAAALFLGMLFALTLGNPYGRLSKQASKYMLQAAVVGLGFGMNLHESLAAGREGMLMTITSVMAVMVAGCLLGKWMGVSPRLSYLIASGTAICGGSAIAAVAPVVKADENETSVSLAVIFALNALALFIFPPVGTLLGLGEHPFGTWAAIAIHDTSSVVGAASCYGEKALETATTVKLTRALWIIPLSLVSALIFARHNNKQQGGASKASIPWFIFLFIAAMAINTYAPLPQVLAGFLREASHRTLSATLFLIGSGLSAAALRQVGARPVLLGVTLWVFISAAALLAVL